MSDDPSFSLKIATKQEFYENAFMIPVLSVHQDDEYHADEYQDDEMSPHQPFVNNFLSLQNPYNGLLLFHGLGSDKTCTAINICEEMRDTHNGETAVIIFVGNEHVRESFVKKLFDKSRLHLQKTSPASSDHVWTITGSCVGNKLLREINATAQMTKEEIETKIHHLINTYYTFFGYIAFAKEIEKQSKQQPFGLQTYFNNKLVVIDEIHNVCTTHDSLEDQTSGRTEQNRTKQKRTKQNRTKFCMKQIDLLVNTAKNMRLLLLSATPMYNSPKEILWMLNLLNMNDRRSALELKDVFNPDNDNDNDNDDTLGEDNLFVAGGEKLLLAKMKGYVSFVKGRDPYTFPYRVYPNKFDPDRNRSIDIPSDGIFDTTLLKPSNIIVNKLYFHHLTNCVFGCNERSSLQCQMCSFHKEYLETKTPETNNVEKDILVMQQWVQTAIIAHPLSTMLKSKNKGTLFRYKHQNDRYFTQGNIGKYSLKIKSVLDSIKPPAATAAAKGVILVFSSFIERGILPMAIALEEMGFKRFNASNLLKRPKDNSIVLDASYSIICGNKRYSANAKSDLKAMTDVTNKDGHVIKVILMSIADSECIDFKFIRQLHILDPWFNLYRSEQIIGGTIRSLSHADLPFHERNVQIFMHTLIVDLKDADTQTTLFFANELKLYMYASVKCSHIGKITRLMKSIAEDCLLLKQKEKQKETRKQHSSSVSQTLSTGVVVQMPEQLSTDDPFSIPYNCINSFSEDTNIVDPLYQAPFEEIKSKIQSFVKTRYFCTRNELHSHVAAHPAFQIDVALTEMVESNQMIQDVYGKKGTLIHVGEYYLFQPIQ